MHLKCSILYSLGGVSFSCGSSHFLDVFDLIVNILGWLVIALEHRVENYLKELTVFIEHFHFLFCFDPT